MAPWMVLGGPSAVAMDGPGGPIIGGDHPLCDSSSALEFIL